MIKCKCVFDVIFGEKSISTQINPTDVWQKKNNKNNNWLVQDQESFQVPSLQLSSKWNSTETFILV